MPPAVPRRDRRTATRPTARGTAERPGRGLRPARPVRLRATDHRALRGAGTRRAASGRCSGTAQGDPARAYPTFGLALAAFPERALERPVALGAAAALAADRAGPGPAHRGAAAHRRMAAACAGRHRGPRPASRGGGGAAGAGRTGARERRGGGRGADRGLAAPGAGRAGGAPRPGHGNRSGRSSRRHAPAWAGSRSCWTRRTCPPAPPSATS